VSRTESPHASSPHAVGTTPSTDKSAVLQSSVRFADGLDMVPKAGPKPTLTQGPTRSKCSVQDESSFANEQAAFDGGGPLPLWSAAGPRRYQLDRNTWVERHVGSISLVDLDIDESGF
jgi:hypothetical protein